MENLENFVRRLSKSVGCYHHMTRSGIGSLKRVNSSYKREMGVFAWVVELRRRNLFKIDTYKDLADKAGVANLADGEKERLNWEETGSFFYVNRNSDGEDYQKAVTALKAIKSLKDSVLIKPKTEN